MQPRFQQTQICPRIAFDPARQSKAEPKLTLKQQQSSHSKSVKAAGRML
jgi:hypothetical protein